MVSTLLPWLGKLFIDFGDKYSGMILMKLIHPWRRGHVVSEEKMFPSNVSIRWEGEKNTCQKHWLWKLVTDQVDETYFWIINVKLYSHSQSFCFTHLQIQVFLQSELNLMNKNEIHIVCIDYDDHSENEGNITVMILFDLDILCKDSRNLLAWIETDPSFLNNILLVHDSLNHCL